MDKTAQRIRNILMAKWEKQGKNRKKLRGLKPRTIGAMARLKTPKVNFYAELSTPYQRNKKEEGRLKGVFSAVNAEIKELSKAEQRRVLLEIARMYRMQDPDDYYIFGQ